MESNCDVGGPKYPWTAVDKKMKSSRVGLSPRCHRMIELVDNPRVVESMWLHELLRMISLYEEHGVSEPRVRSKCRKVVVNLSMEISLLVANIPRDGVAGEVRYPNDAYRRYVWATDNTLIRWRGWRPGSRSG